MASGHWQATAPKENREQGGGCTPAFPAALRAARPRGARTVATGGHGLPQPSEEEVQATHLKGILGDPLHRKHPGSHQKWKDSCFTWFRKCKRFECGLPCGSALGGASPGRATQRRSLDCMGCAWKQPESSMGKRSEWGAQRVSWSPWTSVSWTGSVQDSAPGMTHHAPTDAGWLPTGARSCCGHRQ